MEPFIMPLLRALSDANASQAGIAKACADSLERMADWHESYRDAPPNTRNLRQIADAIRGNLIV